MTDPRHAPRGRVLLALLTIYVLFGSGYLGIRLLMDDVDAVQAMAHRFLIAALILMVVVLAREGPGALRVTRQQVWGLVVTGSLLLGLGNGLSALAQVAGLASGVAALVIAMIPVWTVVLRTFAGDVPSGMTVVGVLLGVAGLVALVVLGREERGVVTVAGVVIAGAAGLCWAIGSFSAQGRVSLPRSVFASAMYQSVVAAVFCYVFALLIGERFSVAYSWRGIAGLSLLVLISVVGFSAFAWLLEHARLSVVSTHAYVNPVVAVAFGWLLLSEPVGRPVIWGGGLVLTAVVVIVVGERSGPNGPTRGETDAPVVR